MTAALRDDVRLNESLFARIKAVWDARATLGLTPVQAKLLEETHKSFVRGGANLNPAQKERFRAINQELSVLSAPSQRTCSRRRTPTVWSSTRRRTSPDCRNASSRGRRRRPRPRRWKASGSSRSTPRASGRSSRPPTTASCESRSWPPTRAAARTATLKTTATRWRGSPRSAGAGNRAALLGYKTRRRLRARREHGEGAGQGHGFPGHGGCPLPEWRGRRQRPCSR